MAKGLFVTGTDTGVGKTVVTAALIRAAAEAGLRVCGMKPIETGCRKEPSGVRRSGTEVQHEDLTPSDGMFLKEATGMQESIDLVTPVRFESPLAPMPAAEIEGTPVDMKRIQDAFSALGKAYDAVIVEGIGGLFVPIAKDFFVFDLAKTFGLPLIVVSRPGLGAISHTMLTVDCAVRRGLAIAGIVLNYSRPAEGDLSEKTNPEVIAQICPLPIIGIFPHLPNLQSETIERAAARNLHMEVVAKYL